MIATLRTALIVFLGTCPALAATAPAPTPAAAAADEALDQARAEARAALVGRLLELAVWCNQNQLFEERDRVWRAVIALEPDNLEARKGLRYARNVDGSWKEPSPRPAKNMNATALSTLPEKRAEAVKPFSDALIGHARDASVSAADRDAILSEILAVDPDDAQAREILGEVQAEGGAWVLRETAVAKERRPAIRAAVEAAKTAAPGLVPAAATADEKKHFDKWKSGAQSGTVRVIGTGEAKACEDLANHARIAGAVFEAVLGAPPSWAEGFGIYIATGTGERDAFIAGLEGLDDARREALKKTTGGGVPGTWKIVLFDADEKRRRDCGVRHTIAHLLRQGWKVETTHAWIFEGLGLYLTREICGTRLTWFCSGSGVANEGKNSPRGKLIIGDVNWMNEAYKLLTRETPVDLATVLGKDLATMGVEDVLVSYALCAYVVEGRPEATSALLQAVGEGAAPADAIQKSLGMTVPELQRRLVRWLSERK